MFVSPTRIHKRLIVLANMRDAAAMPTPLNWHLGSGFERAVRMRTRQRLKRVSYKVGHKWDKAEGREAGRTRTTLCFVFRRLVGSYLKERFLLFLNAILLSHE